MSVRIGINPISWSNDDLQYVGGDILLHTCLEQAALAGYAGVELGHKFPRDASRLKPLLDSHGLRLVSGWYSGQLLSRDDQAEAVHMSEHLQLLLDMGCEVLVFAEVSGCIHSDPDVRLSRRPRLSPGQWKEFGQRLTNLARLTADKGVRLCYHHHMGTVVQTAEDVDALMSSTTDDVQLLLDTGHAYFAGADPLELAKTYADRVGHLHCKDIRPKVMASSLNRDASFLDSVLDGVFTVPGDGCIEYDRILEVLSGAGYSGWAVVEAEQDPSVAPPLKYATMGRRYLSGIIKEYYSG